VRIGTSVVEADPDSLLSAVGFEVIDEAKRAAMKEDRGAKW
jgi:hypothetical protein